MAQLRKIAVHQACLDHLKQKIERLQKMVDDAQRAASEDTKSSAGDKFETSREMMKREIDKFNQQIGQSNKMLQLLSQLDPTSSPSKVGVGSLLETNEGWYYLSVSLGKLVVAGTTVFALSLASPLGQALAGKGPATELTFRNRKLQIHSLS